MVPRLAEVHMYVSTSKALLAAIRKNVGLAPNASANKIIEAIQVLSARALDEVGGADIIDELEKILGVSEDEIVENVRTLKSKDVQSQLQNEQDQNSDSEDDE